MRILHILIAVFAAPFFLLMAYSFIIWLPVNVYNEAECLRKGYPEHRTSIGLERYCMNLDGSITVNVDKQ